MATKNKAPSFGDVVGYWPKHAPEVRVPAVVCGFYEDKAGRFWAELRPQIPPSMCANWRETDLDFCEVAHGNPGQPGTWTFLDEEIPTPSL